MIIDIGLFRDFCFHCHVFSHVTTLSSAELVVEGPLRKFGHWTQRHTSTVWSSVSCCLQGQMSDRVV